MRRLITIIFCISFGLAATAQSNAVTIRIGSDEGISGTEVLIPVTTENFTDILSAQGSISFDHTLLQFIGTENYGLPGMTAASFGTNQSSQGYLSFSWYDASLSGESVTDGSVLFTIRFEITGESAQATPVQLCSDITPVEVVNTEYNTLTVYDQTGQVNILDNPNPGEELTIGFSDHSVSEGQEILIPVEVSNFNEMLSLQGSIDWDPSVLSYVSTEAYNLTGVNTGSFGVSQTSSGKLTFSWNDMDLSGESIPDGHSIFSIRFIASGNTGDVTTIRLDNQPTQIEFSDTSMNPVDYTLIPGTVTIENSSQLSDVAILADSVEGGMGAVIQLPVKVRNFTDIISLQGSMSFDPAIAEFDTVIQYGLPSLAYANFGTNNSASGTLSFSWNDPTLAGISLPDDSAIYILQFTLTGNIGDISPLNFIETPTPFECIKNDFSVLNTSRTNGQMEIIDIYQLDILGITDTEYCAGESFTANYFAEGNFLPGNIFNLEMSDNSGDFSSPMIIGYANSTTSGSITANLPDDLLNGNYKLRLSATQPVYTGSIFNSDLIIHQLPSASTGDDEDICFGDDVTLTATGGTTYSWNTGDNTDNITVSPGTDTEYIVTVQDAWGCLDSDTVNVTVNPLPDAQAGDDQDICLGETATLTANNGNNYHWSTGDDLQSIQVNPETSTEYIVTVTDGNLCSDTDTVTVNVFEVVADAGDNQDICAGESVTLNASGGTGYQWSSGDNTGSTTVSPLTDTEYYVTVTGVNLCTDIDTVMVYVHQLPPANAGDDEDICFGDDVTLTATGGTTYSWNTGDNTDNITVSPGTDTEYIVTVQDAWGCLDSDTVNVTVNPLPDAQASDDQDICLGETTTLTASNGNNYHWNTGDDLQSIQVSPGTSTEYIVTVTDGNLCSDTDTVTVNVFEVVADAGDDQHICAGGSITLSASGGTGYQWSSGDNTGSTTISPLTNTEYYVTVTGVNLCTDVDTVLVYVHQLPPANAGDDEDICFGDDVTLTATGGTTYSWNTGDNTDNITVSPGTDTEYIVTVEDDWGCLDSDTVNVNVNPLPDAQAGDDQDICLGETTTLTANNGNNYHWSTGDDLQSIQVSPGTSTEYIVTVTDGNLCSDTDTVTVNVFEVVADAGDDQDICAGGSVTLNASGGTGYQWSSGDNTGSTTVSPLTDTEYYVTVTGVNLCTDVDTVLVYVHQLPPANAGDDEDICLGETVTLTATGGTTYSWNTGDNTDNITVSPGTDTEYIVTVEDAWGCLDSDTVNVNVNPLPDAQAGEDQDICLGETATLTASNGNNYHWSTGDDLQSIQVNPETDTEYIVTVTDGNLCSDTDTVTVNVFEVVADAGDDQDICAGGSVTLNASGGTGYQWSSGDNTGSTTVSPLTDTEYYVTVTGVNLCTDVDTVMVYVHQLPPANAGDDEDICFGDDVTLTATGGTTYSWNTGDNTDNITVSPETDTEYIVTVEDDWGCLDSDTVNVTVNPLPDAQAGDDQDICLGETATLTASNGNNYHWNTGDNLQSIQVSPETSTEYIVTVTDGNLCSDTDTVTVNVFEVVADAGDDQDICAGGSVTLSASGGTGYQWSSGDNTGSTTVSPLADTEYYVTVTGVNLCTDIDTVLVSVLTMPETPSIPSGISERCSGSGINDYTTLQVSGATSYTWDMDVPSAGNIVSTDTSASIQWEPEFSGNINLFVMATNQCGNSVSDSLLITIHPSPEINLGNDTIICSGDSLLLSAPEADTYIWSTGSSEQEIFVQEANTYRVEITDGICSSSDSLVLNVSSPEFDFGTDSIFTGLPYELSAPSGYSEYLWIGGLTTESITVTEFGWYSVLLTNEYGCTVTDSVYIDDNTGILAFNSQDIEIYPNPATDKLTVQYQGKIRAVCIIDMNGKILDYVTNIREPLILDVSRYQPGLFILRIYLSNSQINKKFMIK